MAWFRVENTEAAATVEEGAVDASMVGGIIVDDAVIQLSQRGAGYHLLNNLPVFNLGKADDIRHLAKLVAGKHYGLGYAIALVAKVRPCFE